jgi:putative ABC transport system permease protein
MTRTQFIYRNLSRNLRRTLLTGASVAASILLLAVFCATYRYMAAPPAPQSFDLILMVASRTSLMGSLPLHYGQRIARLPGVEAVSPINMVDALYGAEDELVFALACEPDALFRVRSDWKMPEDQRRAFREEKTALVCSRSAAQKHHWKLGDRIHLRSSGYNLTLDLVLRAIYTSQEDESLMAFHWDYLNEVQGRRNRPGAFWVMARSAEDVPRLMRAIDAEFRNSDVETRTQPMKQFVLDFLAMLGNVRLILIGISAAVVFAVLLIVTNTVGMSIRERTSELAVLRALGFRTRQVLGLLTAESLAITVLGATVGCVGAALLLWFASGFRVGGAMPVYIQIDAPTIGMAFSVAVGISLVSTLLPAYRAARLSIAEALRYVG